MDQNTTNNQSGQEPVSGVTGAGTANQPFDQGNQGASGNDNLSNTSNTGNTTDRLGGQSDTATSGTGAQGRNVGGDVRPLHDTDKTGVTSVHSNDPKFSDQKLSSSNDTSQGGTVGGVGATDSSVNADPASGQKPQQKQQGADRPNEEPTGDGAQAVKDSKDRSDDAHKGPAPGAPAATSAKGDGPQTESKGEGTGEKWVKSTGMVADGGDFDAAKPGAGREADRLLEQKGVHRTEQPKPDLDEITSKKGHGIHLGSGGDKSSDKPGVGEKIKEKLHLGHKE